MRKIIFYTSILIIVIFFASYKNITINVVKAVQTTENGKIIRKVITTDKHTFYVPYDRDLNLAFFKNLILLNLDADEDWQKLQKPGIYNVRVYGIRTFFSDNKLNIIKVLKHKNEQPKLVYIYYTFKKFFTMLAIAYKDALKKEVDELRDFHHKNMERLKEERKNSN
jgi:hypothetical protein